MNFLSFLTSGGSLPSWIVGWIAQILASLGVSVSIDVIFMFVDAIPDILKLIQMAGDSDIQGQEKLEEVVRESSYIMDEYADGVPYWKQLSEQRRDRILSGLVELILFVEMESDRSSGRRPLRKGLRNLRQRILG